MRWFNDWGKRFLSVTGFVILILLVTDFNSRMAELTRLRAQKENEMQRIEDLSATQSVLETQIAYAESDEAVEEWAREQERSVLPGDFPVVPLADPDFELTQNSNNMQIEKSHSHWDNWVIWLFGADEISLP